MIKRQEGSLIIVMLGLFWLTGIMTAVLYAIVAHISTLVTLREVHMRYWHLLNGGMVIALAHMNETPDLYVKEQQPFILYEGPWRIDPRHTMLRLKLLVDRKDVLGPACTVRGELFNDKSMYLIVIWHLVYDEAMFKWVYLWGERIYR